MADLYYEVPLYFEVINNRKTVYERAHHFNIAYRSSIYRTLIHENKMYQLSTAFATLQVTFNSTNKHSTACHSSDSNAV